MTETGGAWAPNPPEVRVADPDRDLVERWKTGDHDAVVEAFTRYSESVRRFLARITGSKDDDVDDLVQQSFLVAHRAIHKFRGDSSLLTWLFGIAVRCARRLQRGRARRHRAYERLADASTAETSSLDVEARQQLRLLAIALGELDADLRVAFVLCVMEQVPGKQAAHALGIPPGTLARRVHSARERLRDAVERTRR